MLHHLGRVKSVVESQGQVIVAKVTLIMNVQTPEGGFSHYGGRARVPKTGRLLVQGSLGCLCVAR